MACSFLRCAIVCVRKCSVSLPKCLSKWVRSLTVFMQRGHPWKTVSENRYFQSPSPWSDLTIDLVVVQLSKMIFSRKSDGWPILNILFYEHIYADLSWRSEHMTKVEAASSTLVADAWFGGMMVKRMIEEWYIVWIRQQTIPPHGFNSSKTIVSLVVA